MGTSSSPDVSEKLARTGGDDDLVTITKPAATAATSTSPFGYSEAQANALITGFRALVTELAAKGIINEA